MDNLQLSIVIILAGLTIVFLGLIILTVVVQLFGKIVSSIQNRPKGNPKGGDAQSKGSNIGGQASPNIQAAVREKDGVPSDIIAVISAAIAAMLGSSKSFVIKGVKRSKDSRSAWSLAGLLDNTHPF